MVCFFYDKEAGDSDLKRLSFYKDLQTSPNSGKSYLVRKRSVIGIKHVLNEILIHVIKMNKSDQFQIGLGTINQEGNHIPVGFERLPIWKKVFKDLSFVL